MKQVQSLLRSEGLEDKLSEMLIAGLPHALEGRPEERHPMQTSVLTMVNQTLASAMGKAQTSEAACKVKQQAAQAELDARKAVAAAASERLAAAQAAASAQKEALGECKRAVTHEEQEHKRAEAVDKSGKKTMAGIEKNRNKVGALLAGVDVKGSPEDLVEFLEDIKADPVLIAALPSMLAKEPAERAGFDLAVLANVKELLGNQVATLDADIQGESARQADAHGEAMGAFAVLDLARDKVKEVAARLKDAQSTVDGCREQVDQANDEVEKEETTVAKGLVEFSKVEEHARRCREACDLLAQLEKGPELPPAVPDVEMEAAPVEAAAVPDVVMAPTPVAVPE